MFYYQNWDIFCAAVKGSDFVTCRADESINQPKDIRYIVFKHDVETNVGKALRLAEMEHKYGINGTYYVQGYLLNDPQNIAMLKRIQEMGHEISYHYDVLDANGGDYEKADKDFSKWLKKFDSEGFVFKTICQHGNPVKERSGYNSNRDFFRNAEIKSKYPDLVDMVVNYSEHIKRPYKYISDAGYIWKHITEPEINDLNPHAETRIIGNFEKLFKFILSSNCGIVLSTHPHRWENSAVKINAKIIVFKVVRVAVRSIEKVPLAKKMLNRFYFLAKKI